MIELNGEQIAEYLYRSYTAVDGLWFVKVEEKYDFGTALDIDDDVWKVMPKIQARKLKSLANLDKGIDALFECFTTKLTLDGFVFETEKLSDGNGFNIIISQCPWHNIMIKAHRQHLSESVGTRICNTECSVWASEFGDNIYFELGERICKGAKHCILRFVCQPKADTGET